MAENTKKKTRGGFYLIIAILTCPAVYLYGWFRTALDYPGEFSFVYYFPTFIAKIAVGVLFSLGVVLLVIRCKHRNSKGKIRLEKTYIFGLFLNILCLFFMIHFMSGERIPPSMNKVVFPGEGYVAVAPGLCHVIALKEDGSIVGWGNDEYLRDIPEGNDFVSIAAGSSYSLALRADGTIAAWGDIYSGHWLDNRAVTDVPRGDGFNAIAAGELHCLALKSDGRIICWGTDFYKPYADIPVTNNFVAIDT